MPTPKRIIALAFAAAALALAACNNGNINNLYGSATPVPTTTPSTTPNPQASTATVQVFYSSSPLPNQPVALSTADASGHAGTPIATQTTDPTGTTIFSNLTPGGNYCFSSTYTPPGGLTEKNSQCPPLWGTYTTQIGF